MKSLHINSERTWRGGEQQVIYLLRGLLDRGDETRLVCQPGSRIAARAEAEGIPFTALRMLGDADLIAAWHLVQIMRREKCRIVHVHTPHAHMLSLLAGPFGGRPPIVCSKRTDFSIFRNSFFGMNLLKYAHGIHRYIAISHAVRDVLVRDGVPPRRISVVRSCIDPDRVGRGDGWGLLEELGLSPENLIVGNVGHLVPHKGQRTLLEAVPRILREVPQARFVIVGEGELEADLKRRAEDLGIGGEVLFPGFRDDVSSFLSIFRIFAMPSHMEGLGTAVLDALAVRLPVIATTAGGIPEMIRDGVNGLLVPPRDPGALARAIISLLKDPARARALGEAGYETVRREFAVETMVDQTRAIYGEILDGTRR